MHVMVLVDECIIFRCDRSFKVDCPSVFRLVSFEVDIWPGYVTDNSLTLFVGANTTRQ